MSAPGYASRCRGRARSWTGAERSPRVLAHARRSRSGAAQIVAAPESLRAARRRGASVDRLDEGSDDARLLLHPSDRSIDAATPAAAPLFTVHLGAGALTLPRYVAATRPLSRQLVVEFEPDLYAAVLAALPLPAPGRRAGDSSATLATSRTPRVHPVDGRAVHRRRPLGCRRHPPPRREQEFYDRVAARSAPGGVVAVNLLDGHPFTRDGRLRRCARCSNTSRSRSISIPTTRTARWGTSSCSRATARWRSRGTPGCWVRPHRTCSRATSSRTASDRIGASRDGCRRLRFTRSRRPALELASANGR